MLRLFLRETERSALRHGAALSPSPEHRIRCRLILWLSRGESVLAIARAFQVSRPTVYRYASIWAEFRDVAALHPCVARRLSPWRSRRIRPRG